MTGCSRSAFSLRLCGCILSLWLIQRVSMISAYARKSVAALSSLVLQPKVAAILRRSLVLTGSAKYVRRQIKSLCFPSSQSFMKWRIRS